MLVNAISGSNWWISLSIILTFNVKDPEFLATNVNDADSMWDLSFRWDTGYDM